MTTESSLLTRWSGLVSAPAIRAWMSTLDYRSYFYESSADPRWGCEQPRMYVFWHEYILVPLYLRPNCDLVMMLSRHRDANVLARVANHMGFGCVRGSTNRGAAAALREMARIGQGAHLTITPDGPRGPRRHMASGAVYLASKLGLPIVPLGFGADQPWRMKSWDRFALPRPFSRVRAVVGPAIPIPSDLGRVSLEQTCRRVERLLNDLTTEAETWAESGQSRINETYEGRRPKSLVPWQNNCESHFQPLVLPPCEEEANVPSRFVA